MTASVDLANNQYIVTLFTKKIISSIS